MRVPKSPANSLANSGEVMILLYFYIARIAHLARISLQVSTGLTRRDEPMHMRGTIYSSLKLIHESGWVGGRKQLKLLKIDTSIVREKLKINCASTFPASYWLKGSTSLPIKLHYFCGKPYQDKDRRIRCPIEKFSSPPHASLRRRELFMSAAVLGAEYERRVIPRTSNQPQVIQRTARNPKHEHPGPSRSRTRQRRRSRFRFETVSEAI